MPGEVNAVDYDPKGELLAISGYFKDVYVYSTETYEVSSEFH